MLQNPAPKIKIWLWDRLPSADAFAKLLDNDYFELRRGGDEYDFECEILIHYRPLVAELHKFENLKLIILPFAGPSVEKVSECAEFSQYVGNLHWNAAPTAETAIGLLINCAKLTIPCHNKMMSNDWTGGAVPFTPEGFARSTPQKLLYGKTVCILGYGEIGSRVGAVCKALGMKVIPVKSRRGTINISGEPTNVYTLDDFEIILPQANVLINALPLNSKTDGCVDGHAFSLLPADSIVINVGRGGTMCEQSLFNALKSKRVWAAGLDVFWNGPPYAFDMDATNHKTGKLDFSIFDNVVFSPHRAAGVGSPDMTALQAEILAKSVNAVKNRNYDAYPWIMRSRSQILNAKL